MSWRPVGRHTGKKLLRYLREEEWSHMALSSRVRNTATPPRFGQIADGRIWARENGNNVTGAFFISRYGVLLPVYKPQEMVSEDRSFLRKLVFSRRDRLFSIIGIEERVRDVENLIDEIPPDVETYRVFTSDNKERESGEVPPEIKIERASTEHLDKLWPLEKSYQYEEVLRKGSFMNERSGKRHFLETLQNQVVFFASLNGRPVAKAGTNARGWGWDQIGGVFVIPELRGSGFGRTVMQCLLAQIRKDGKKPCLFVKESNEAALGLYHRLAFNDRGSFRISYWSH